MNRLVLGRLHAALEAEEFVVLATVVRTRGSAPRGAGARLLLHSDDRLSGTIGGGTVEHRVVAQMRAARSWPAPRTLKFNLAQDVAMCCGGEMEVLVEPVHPQPLLLVFGAGHVAHALAQVAHVAGWRLVVVDDRSDLLTEERFPHAERILEDALVVFDELPWSPHLSALIITHSHQLDEQLLERALARPHRFLGMIGSRAKVRRFQQRLLARGVSREALARVQMPVGLGFGDKRPGQIAVSIMAQLLLDRSGDSTARRLSLPD